MVAEQISAFDIRAFRKANQHVRPIARLAGHYLEAAEILFIMSHGLENRN
jgi:hypothetical protein